MSYKSAQRSGITHELASIIDVFLAAPLHSYLRILDWFLNVGYSIAAGKSKWLEDQSVRDYKSLIWNRINGVTNLPFDQPGGSGNTSTGNIARILFSYKEPCFSIALSFVLLTFKGILSKINMSALLKIANSNESGDVERFLVISQNIYMILETLHVF